MANWDHKIMTENTFSDRFMIVKRYAIQASEYKF